MEESELPNVFDGASGESRGVSHRAGAAGGDAITRPNPTNRDSSGTKPTDGVADATNEHFPAANTFGDGYLFAPPLGSTMASTPIRLEATDAPADRPTETMDVRTAPPPEPLRRTLERLAELDDRTVLVQLNDRAPQHLFPRLDDRGYRYETVDADDAVVTAIWRA